MGLNHSTHCSDPLATHTVEVAGGRFGYGIYGYYTNEVSAHRVKREIQSHGGFATVSSYSADAPVVSGIHPLIEAHLFG